MEEQKYTINNIKSFELKDIFECGQCFRWNKQEDGSYIGIFRNKLLEVEKIEKEVIFKGICEGKI